MSAVVNGGAEKGPLVLGSSVTVSPIDTSGNPTGATFKTQTTSDAGAFELTLPLSGFHAFEVTGFQFNELAGELSGAPITLRAYADVNDGAANTVYINVVTHLGERRVRQLLAQGVSLAPATAQVDAEVQAAIQVGVSGFNPGIDSNKMTMLGGDTDPNAYLLAVSAIFLHAATEAVGPGGPVDAQLQEMLNTFAQDLEDDGQIDTPKQTSLLTAQATLDTALVKANLAGRMDALGLTGSVPDIDRILDQDQDGLVNVDDNCPRVANADQTDTDQDGIGDACTPCGDGRVNHAGEECDDGNSDDTDACLSSCVAATCGDGFVWAGVEGCDDGNDNDLDACNNLCEPTECGDGVVQRGEECDDGNGDEYDGCTSQCKPPECGDGIVHPALGEACDDGNNLHGDGCFDCYALVGLFAAGDRTCGLASRANGQQMLLKCWGDNAHGALGQGDTENRGDQPGELEAMAPIDLGGQSGNVAMGLSHNCSMVTGVGVKCWGRNTEGQLGLGDTLDRGDSPGEMGAALPVVVPEQGGAVIYSASDATCVYSEALMKTFCWGSGAHGVFANGSSTPIGDSPTSIPVSDGNSVPGFDAVAELPSIQSAPSGGNDHLCARRHNGGVLCWGRNDFGQLGIGSTQAWGDEPGETVGTLPQDGTALSLFAAPVVTGRAHSCFWSNSLSAAVCFGANNGGQLGLDHTESIGDVPGEVAALTGIQFLENGFLVGGIASGGGADFTCIHRAGIWCWGDGSSGQLGRGNTENLGDQPGEMAMLHSLPSISLGGEIANQTSSIAVGRAHVCARLTDNRIKCWGDNSKGQLGLGDSENRGDDPGEMGAALPSVPFP